MSRTTDRWRATLIASCMMILVVAANGFLAVGGARLHAEQRILSRGYDTPAKGESPDYLRTVFYDAAPDGSAIVVVSWHIVETAPLPRGFPENARVGVFYLSPALANLAVMQPTIRERFDYRGVEAFDARFIGQADELIAYRLVDDPRGFGDPLVNRPGSDTVGDTLLPRGQSTIAPTVLLLLLPGIGLIWAASSVSATRVHRQLDILNLLGASRHFRRAVAYLHALAMAIPGVVLGAATWSLWSRRLAHVPLTNLAVREGDLSLTLLETVGISLAIVMLYGGALAALTTRTTRHRGRPSDYMPMLVIGLTMQLFAPMADGRKGFALYLAGVVAMIVGTPPLVEMLYRWAGSRLAAVGTWRTLIAGRRLTDAARGSARSQTAWVSILIVLPLAGAWISTVRLTDTPRESPTSVIEASAPDIGHRRKSIEGAVGAASAQVAIEPLSPNDIREPRRQLVGMCDELSGSLDLTCSSDGTFLVPRDVPGLEGFEEAASSRIPDGFILDQSSLLFFGRDDRQLENSLRTLAATTPGLSVVSDLTEIQRESPLVSYVLGTLTTMTAITIMALSLSIIGHAARTARGRQRLSAIGASRAAIGAVAAFEAAVIVGLAALATIPSTALSLWSMRRLEPDTVIPLSVLWWVAAAMVVGSAGAGVAAAVTSLWSEPAQE